MKQQYSLFFVLFACLLLSLLYCPVYDMLFIDKEVFRYAGWALSKGQVPYRDFFDHKPPLIFFLNYAGLLFGGWGLWIIDLLLALSATWLFFDLCKRHRLPFPWLLPLLFNLMIRDFLVSKGIGLTREYTSFFLLFFFCVLLGKNKARYFLLGLLSALIFFMQQDQLLPLLPFLLYAVQVKEPGESGSPGNSGAFISRLIKLAAGFLSVMLPILLYFALHRALPNFWQDAFAFNFSWYTAEKGSWADHFRSLKTFLDNGNYEMPFMIAMTLGVTALFLKNRKKPLVLASLAAVLLSFGPELMGARAVSSNFAYYLVPLSASLSILLFCVFAYTEDPVLRDRRAQIPYAFLLCCSLSYTALQHATHNGRYDKDPVVTSPAMGYLRQHRPGDYQLFVFGNGDFISAYNEFKILAPSPWIYQHFWMWYDRWDPDQGLLKSIGQDLSSHRTTYVLMDTSYVDLLRNPANRAWWLSFLETHYRQVPLSDAGSITLWELKAN